MGQSAAALDPTVSGRAQQREEGKENDVEGDSRAKDHGEAMPPPGSEAVRVRTASGGAQQREEGTEIDGEEGDPVAEGCGTEMPPTVGGGGGASPVPVVVGDVSRVVGTRYVRYLKSREAAARGTRHPRHRQHTVPPEEVHRESLTHKSVETVAELGKASSAVQRPRWSPSVKSDDGYREHCRTAKNSTLQSLVPEWADAGEEGERAEGKEYDSVTYVTGKQAEVTAQEYLNIIETGVEDFDGDDYSYAPPTHATLLVGQGRMRHGGGSATPVSVLFDIGAGTTFYGPAAVAGHESELRTMPGVGVRMATGDVTASSQYGRFSFEMDCAKGKYNVTRSGVYLPNLEGYDIVLGLDWFLANKPTIRWKDRGRVEFVVCKASGCVSIEFEVTTRVNMAEEKVISEEEYLRLMDSDAIEQVYKMELKATDKAKKESRVTVGATRKTATGDMTASSQYGTTSRTMRRSGSSRSGRWSMRRRRRIWRIVGGVTRRCSWPRRRRKTTSHRRGRRRWTISPCARSCSSLLRRRLEFLTLTWRRLMMGVPR